MQEQSHVAHPSIHRTVSTRGESKDERTNTSGQQTALRPSSRSATNLAGVCADKRYRHAMCFKRHGTHAVHRSTHRTSPRRSCRHRRPRQPPTWRRYRPWLRVARFAAKNEQRQRGKRGGRAIIRAKKIDVLLYVYVGLHVRRNYLRHRNRIDPSIRRVVGMHVVA